MCLMRALVGRCSYAYNHSTCTCLAHQVKEAMEELFSVRCPRTLTSPPDATEKEDFESHDLGYTSERGGHVVIDQYPMCGRKSIRNPSYIVNRNPSNAVSVSTYKYVSQFYGCASEPSVTHTGFNVISLKHCLSATLKGFVGYHL